MIDIRYIEKNSLGFGVTQIVSQSIIELDILALQINTSSIWIFISANFRCIFAGTIQKIIVLYIDIL